MSRQRDTEGETPFEKRVFPLPCTRFRSPWKMMATRDIGRDSRLIARARFPEPFNWIFRSRWVSGFPDPAMEAGLCDFNYFRGRLSDSLSRLAVTRVANGTVNRDLWIRLTVWHWRSLDRDGWWLLDLVDYVNRLVVKYFRVSVSSVFCEKCSN